VLEQRLAAPPQPFVEPAGDAEEREAQLGRRRESIRGRGASAMRRQIQARKTSLHESDVRA
jgi:hypothetical protein